MGGLSPGRAGCFMGEGSILVLKDEAGHLLDQAVPWSGGVTEDGW